jgi:hypothetical protein
MKEKTAKRISVRTRQFTSDSELLGERWAQLLKTHPLQWVGVYRGEFVFAASQAECIKKLGENARNAPVRHLNPKPPKYILLQGACFSIADEDESARPAA